VGGAAPALPSARSTIETRPSMNLRSLLVAFLFAALTPASAFGQATPPLEPRLVLVLSIDQMRYDYLTRLGPLFKGGLRLLLDRGAVFTNAMYRHSASETGPGHSVILSGRHPRHSGIVANDWYDAYLGRSVNVIEDPVQRPLGGSGRSASPANAMSFTIGDVLKARSPGSHVVGVSAKDRSAILMGGRRADAAYWYETAGGNFITSTFYMDEAPPWLVALNDRHLADAHAGKLWTRLLADTAIYERYAGEDAVEGEWDRKDIVFPHVIRGKPPEVGFYDDLRRTPFIDEMTLDVALEAMAAHHIGEDDVTDVLAIGFSGTDVIGHTYGADSQESMDQLLRLDLVLDRLFDQVEAKVGLSNTLVVLTADHGSLPLVENLQAKGVDAKRVAPAVLRTAVDAAFAKAFPGVTNLVLSYAAPDFYLSQDVIQRNDIDRGRVEAVAIEALLATGLVAKVYTATDLRGTQASSDPYLRLFQNAFYEPRSPQLNVLLKPYVYLNGQVGGTGHGTAHEYDRHVPIVFMGRDVKPGFYDGLSGPEDIAPTLGLMLGLEFPREDDSRLLVEMLPPS
jgi:predicted AlkP superfamily pyrophosphatase or phosphodiesterase